MPTLLLRNIAQIWQTRDGNAVLNMQELPSLENAYLLVEDGKIAAFGRMQECPERADHIVEAAGRHLFPTWCDSHTHIVFAQSREQEFVDRIKGMSYEEIARRGGGILNSARKLRETPEERLLESALERVEEIISYGTGAVEIKSGYGLSLESELKMLRVIRKIKEEAGIPVKATFLGAHALPPEYRDSRKAYVDLVVEQMLPQIVQEGLADYVDVFCEKGFFTVEETVRIIEAGAKHGLKAKVHTNQFNSLGCIEACVKHGALTVDHMEVVNEAEIESLKSGTTLPTLLPSAPFFIGGHYQPARRLLDAGLPVALATDYNPGSTPSGKMQFVLSLACIKCGMLPEEAINAATIMGAKAMEVEDTHGSIQVGKQASFFLTPPLPSLAYLPYAFGSDLVEQVYINGVLKADKRR
jgi:imidazolonepropionase